MIELMFVEAFFFKLLIWIQGVWIFVSKVLPDNLQRLMFPLPLRFMMGDLANTQHNVSQPDIKCLS